MDIVNIDDLIKRLNKNKECLATSQETYTDCIYFSVNIFKKKRTINLYIEFYKTYVRIKHYDIKSFKVEYKDEPLVLDLFNMLMEREPKINEIEIPIINSILSNIVLRLL